MERFGYLVIMACIKDLKNVGTAKGLIGRLKEIYQELTEINDILANVSGTEDEVEVTIDPENGYITIGLPDDVTITNNLTVGNNIYVSEDKKVFYDN